MQMILYWFVAFKQTPDAFFMQYVTLFMLSHCAAALGYTVSALAPNFITAAMIGQGIIIPMVLFGGLLVNMDTVFPWIAWL